MLEGRGFDPIRDEDIDSPEWFGPTNADNKEESDNSTPRPSILELVEAATAAHLAEQSEAEDARRRKLNLRSRKINPLSRVWGSH